MQQIPSKKQKPSSIWIKLLFLLLLALVGFGIYYAAVKSEVNWKAIFKKLLEKLETIHEKKPNEFYLFMFIFQLLDMILILPFYTFSNILFAYMIKKFWLSSILLTIIPTVATVLMYLMFSGKGCVQLFKDKLHHYQAYQVLVHNTTSSRVLLAFIVRFLYIPLGSKEYILLILGYPFSAIFFSGLVYFFLHGLLFSAIGIHLKNISEALKNKFWTDMDFGERAEFVSIIMFMLLTVVIFVYLNYWLNKKAKEQPAYSEYSRFSIQSLPNFKDAEEKKNETQPLLCRSTLK